LNSTIHAASRHSTLETASAEVHDGSSSLHPTQNFAELATDVSSLANLLGNATRDIDQLSEVIRDEAKDSLEAMQATIAQVDVTERLSRDAHTHLKEISTAAEALGAAIVEVSQRSTEQASGVTELASNARVINDITHDTAKALAQAVEDLQQLEDLSNSLDASVHGFRLPPEPAT